MQCDLVVQLWSNHACVRPALQVGVRRRRHLNESAVVLLPMNTYLYEALHDKIQSTWERRVKQLASPQRGTGAPLRSARWCAVLPPRLSIRSDFMIGGNKTTCTSVDSKDACRRF
jgi:hypothetical protein